ncbi:hypothetical protein [Pseudoalteromonas spongiae]|uniref:Uncharacterized protein n=1 Tax=Pseudoalteromonas spongiae TaxID=298657 RepID=A0ABU8ESH9_9GAMM|nr:hypothetical protein [Pseudoalteromonas spongiae]
MTRKTKRYLEVGFLIAMLCLTLFSQYRTHQMALKISIEREHLIFEKIERIKSGELVLSVDDQVELLTYSATRDFERSTMESNYWYRQIMCTLLYLVILSIQFQLKIKIIKWLKRHVPWFFDKY